jgi:hypothetical protein
MVSELLNRLRSKQPKPGDLWNEYRTILERHDRPKSADVDRLPELLNALGLKEGDVEKHIAALDEMKRLADVSADLPKAQTEYVAIDRQEREGAIALQKHIDAETCRLNKLSGDGIEVQQRIRVGRDAATELASLQSDHRQLLGLPEPVRTALPGWWTHPVTINDRLVAEANLGHQPEFMAGKPFVERVRGLMDKLALEKKERQEKGEHPPQRGPEPRDWRAERIQRQLSIHPAPGNLQT